MESSSRSNVCTMEGISFQKHSGCKNTWHPQLCSLIVHGTILLNCQGVISVRSLWDENDCYLRGQGLFLALRLDPQSWQDSQDLRGSHSLSTLMSNPVLDCCWKPELGMTNEGSQAGRMYMLSEPVAWPFMGKEPCTPKSITHKAWKILVCGSGLAPIDSGCQQLQTR